MATKNVMKRLWRTKQSGPVLRIFPLKGNVARDFYILMDSRQGPWFRAIAFFNFSTPTGYNSCTVSSVGVPVQHDPKRCPRISQNIPARNYLRRSIKEIIPDHIIPVILSFKAFLLDE
jgi:hypothetical protein